MPNTLTKCPACGALANPAWLTCAACKELLTAETHSPEASHVMVPAPAEPVIVEPAPESVRRRPVFWQSGVQIHGPATVTDFARSGDDYWVWIVYQGEGRWIRDLLLRSRSAFEAQLGAKKAKEAKEGGGLHG